MLEYEAAEAAEVAREMAASNEIKAMLSGLLKERYKDEFEFSPIVVLPRYNDEFDEAYFHAYIVFHGDYKKLDSLWTLGLSRRLWPRAEGAWFPWHSPPFLRREIGVAGHGEVDATPS